MKVFANAAELQKGVIVTHLNMISEVLLFKLYESYGRTKDQKDTVLGLLPYSHIFGLSVFNAAVYRGESVTVLPKFELEVLLRAIQIHQINRLYLVSELESPIHAFRKLIHHKL